MSDTATTQLIQQLQRGYELIQSNRAESALSFLKPLLKDHQKNPDLLHLMALAEKSLGNFDKSIDLFSKSLGIKKQQPEVHNNLANLYKDQQQLDKAIEHYQMALFYHPGFNEAQVNLALTHLQQNKVKRAATEFESVLGRDSGNVTALIGLADVKQQQEKFDEAEYLYTAAINIQPQRLSAWYKLGQTFHLQAKLAEAENCYRRAIEINPAQFEVSMALGSLLAETDRVEQAIEVFEAALTRAPDIVALHQRFNEIIWESAFRERFCQSYEIACQRLPGALELRTAQANQLLRAGLVPVAEKVVNQALIHFGKAAPLLTLKGKLLGERGDIASSLDNFKASLEKEFVEDTAHSYIKSAIIQEQYLAAQPVLDKLFDLNPDCQMAWALQSLVWRFTDQDKYQWLNDYESMVQGYQLETPEGYSSLDDFLEALRSVLLKLHKADHAPLEQTLRHGSQTAARLLHRSEPELNTLKELLIKIVDKYIASMPDSSEHPLYRRKSSSFEFSGSWSVKLRPHGFHVNHVHPAGWISSSVYVSVPARQASHSPKSGWIKFGESPLGLGNRERIEKEIEPKSGMAVLFPSYMWHGTYDFEGDDDQYRLTAPFDVAPL